MRLRADVIVTGRPLSADPWTTALFVAVTGSAALRLAAPLWPVQAASLYGLAGVLWMVAFGVFTVVYGPMLLRPRPT